MRDSILRPYTPINMLICFVMSECFVLKLNYDLILCQPVLPSVNNNKVPEPFTDIITDNGVPMATRNSNTFFSPFLISIINPVTAVSLPESVLESKCELT